MTALPIGLAAGLIVPPNGAQVTSPAEGDAAAVFQSLLDGLGAAVAGVQPTQAKAAGGPKTPDANTDAAPDPDDATGSTPDAALLLAQAGMTPTPPQAIVPPQAAPAAEQAPEAPAPSVVAAAPAFTPAVKAEPQAQPPLAASTVQAPTGAPQTPAAPQAASDASQTDAPIVSQKSKPKLDSEPPAPAATAPKAKGPPAVRGEPPAAPQALTTAEPPAEAAAPRVQSEAQPVEATVAKPSVTNEPTTQQAAPAVRPQQPHATARTEAPAAPVPVAVQTIEDAAPTAVTPAITPAVVEAAAAPLVAPQATQPPAKPQGAEPAKAEPKAKAAGKPAVETAQQPLATQPATDTAKAASAQAEPAKEAAVDAAAPGAKHETPDTAPQAAATAAPADAARAGAPAGADPVRGAPQTVASLAANIVKKLEGRSTRFDVELDPAGLGKVDVRIEIGAHGKLSASMACETPQAAAELRGRSAELQRALEQAGFNLASGGLSFDVSGGDRWNQQGAQQQQQDSGAWRGKAFAAALGVSDAADETAQLKFQRRSASGVDIRI